MCFRTVFVSVLLVFASVGRVSAQGQLQVSPGDVQTSISVRSNLVIVPALVKTKRGDVVFSLEAGDFRVTDDGVPQQVRLENDADSQPLALVVLAQTGGNGSAHLKDYRNLGAVLEAIVGEVPHVVSVMTFDSSVHVERNFNADTDEAAMVLGELQPGDQGVAILDGVRFATAELTKLPAQYRRAILLLSETRDSGSQASLDDALRAIDNSNTAIYTFAFSSTKTELHHEGAKLPNPFGATKYSMTPYKAGGCMSQEPGADPDAHGSRRTQALDCADDLLPPLRIARMVYIAALDGMKRNTPETIARLTGGEYFGFKDAKVLRQELITIANEVHNRYLLTFQPPAPHAGMHALSVTLLSRPDLMVRARDAYWIDAPRSEGTGGSASHDKQ